MVDMLRMMCAISAPIPGSCRSFSAPGLSSDIATSCEIYVGDDISIIQLSSSTISSKMRSGVEGILCTVPVFSLPSAFLDLDYIIPTTQAEDLTGNVVLYGEG